LVEAEIGACELERMTTANLEQLGRQIEQVIQEHMLASQRVAADAVVRAFAKARAPGGVRRVPARPATGGRRRPSAEIAALGQRLYRAVYEKPGETMGVLAAGVGLSARELHRPMGQLKRAGQVRSVGERHQTRYFPMAAKG